MSEKVDFISNKAGYIVTFLVGMLGGLILDHSTSNKIPSFKEVQDGYIAPAKVRIKCEDLDKNDKLETLMYVDNKPYLLREVNGKPKLSAYEITPVEESRIKESPLVEKSAPEIK